MDLSVFTRLLSEYTRIYLSNFVLGLNGCESMLRGLERYLDKRYMCTFFGKRCGYTNVMIHAKKQRE